MEMLSHRETICIDATFKLYWMGFPLIFLGTVERTKKDYTFVFASIKNAIEKYFPKYKFTPKKMIADGAD